MITDEREMQRVIRFAADWLLARFEEKHSRPASDQEAVDVVTLVVRHLYKNNVI